MNTHVRDNFNETAPAKAAAAGRVIVSTGANSIVARAVAQDDIQTSQTTSSTSYTDLASAGPELTTLSTGTTALIFWSAFLANNGAGNASYVGVAVSGASTVSATDNYSLRYESGAANDHMRAGQFQLFSGLTAGSNTFTLKYRCTAGTSTFANRYIVGFSLS